MSSGGDEPVADNGAPGHSIFAWAILKSLRQIEEDTFTGEDLFTISSSKGSLAGHTKCRNTVSSSTPVTSGAT